MPLCSINLAGNRFILHCSLYHQASVYLNDISERLSSARANVETLDDFYWSKFNKKDNITFSGSKIPSLS